MNKNEALHELFCVNISLSSQTSLLTINLKTLNYEIYILKTLEATFV